MPQVASTYFKAAVIFLLVAVAIGMQMSISGEHNVTGAHAHGALLGWGSLALFGAYFGVQPDRAASRLVAWQFWITVISSAAMTAGLYFLLMGYLAMVPLVMAGSVGFAGAALLFAWLVFVTPANVTQRTGHAPAS